MLRRAAAVVLTAGALLLVPTAALAFQGSEPPATGPGTSDASAGASGGQLEVRVSQSGSTSTGRTFSSSTVAHVSPVCWYGRGMSGYDYFEYWKPGGPARQSPTLDAYAAQGLLHAGYESHATDTEGHWFEATCRTDAPGDYAANYYLSHPAVWVPPGTPEPATDAAVDPAVLAQIASQAMDLPHGTIRWNPTEAGTGATVVNLDTWVWVDDAPTTVSVRAEVPGTWAQVDAVMSGLQVSAPGATSAHCPDAGTPWTPGATSTTCKVTFFRSTANQPVKAGHSLPTATLTAQATWTASWTSSVDANPTALPAQTVTATAEVPVAEIQSIVTAG